MVAGAGLASLANAGCATLGDGLSLPAIHLGNDNMNGFLARLDKAMNSINQGDPFAASFPKEIAKASKNPRFAGEQATVRKALRSILLAGSFRDLPVEGRVHPGMQERMWNAMPEIDEGMLGMIGPP